MKYIFYHHHLPFLVMECLLVSMQHTSQSVLTLLNQTFVCSLCGCSTFSPLLYSCFTSAVTWYKDGRPLTSAAGLTLLKRGQVLEIERAQLSDTGTYRCVAVNLAGVAEISRGLQVYGEWLCLLHSMLMVC